MAQLDERTAGGLRSAPGYPHRGQVVDVGEQGVDVERLRKDPVGAVIAVPN
jgi:hypothetical protein